MAQITTSRVVIVDQDYFYVFRDNHVNFKEIHEELLNNSLYNRSLHTQLPIAKVHRSP